MPRMPVELGQVFFSSLAVSHSSSRAARAGAAAPRPWGASLPGLGGTFPPGEPTEKIQGTEWRHKLPAELIHI